MAASRGRTVQEIGCQPLHLACLACGRAVERLQPLGARAQQRHQVTGGVRAMCAGEPTEDTETVERVECEMRVWWILVVASCEESISYEPSSWPISAFNFRFST